jgi:hypothetical protein
MGKKTTKTSSNTQPWKPAQGDILGSIGTVRNTVGNNQPNLDAISEQIRGYLPGLGQKAFGDSPLLNAGNQYAMDVMGGKYLNANPYLDGMIDATADDVSDRVNSLFARSGASLGTQHAGVLSKELAGAENQMRYGNYAQERQNQQGAASLTPQLFGSQFAGVAPFLAAGQTAGTLPLAGLSSLSPIIGLAGGSGQTSGKQPGGWGDDLLNAALMAGQMAMMASERRLKKNIVKVGELKDGLPVYDFVYRNDPDNQVMRGVMVDEVEIFRPHALGPKINGIQTVNYAHIEPLEKAA